MNMNLSDIDQSNLDEFEDLCLRIAINEGLKSEPVDRDEVFKILNGES
jgi:hypothetical protein